MEIDSCKKELEEELHKIWITKSKKLAFKAGVKWFDDGKKSNKYFLNIIKKKRCETYIDKLQNRAEVAEGQTEVQNLIRNFYSELYAERKDLSTDYDQFFSSRLADLK